MSDYGLKMPDTHGFQFCPLPHRDPDMKIGSCEIAKIDAGVRSWANIGCASVGLVGEVLGIGGYSPPSPQLFGDSTSFTETTEHGAEDSSLHSSRIPQPCPRVRGHLSIIFAAKFLCAHKGEYRVCRKPLNKSLLLYSIGFCTKVRGR